ncbi:MAG TPA: BrnT family toxin, partial [Oligoflexia bacterium]|nr:BrnT family toxin [Oligoflexia bacterium]
NNEKNAALQKERGVSFEDVLAAMTAGGLLDVLEHPKRDRYPNQRIFVVRIEDYAFLVPFTEDGDEIFLKTIIPSRKATRHYLKLV